MRLKSAGVAGTALSQVLSEPKCPSKLPFFSHKKTSYLKSAVTILAVGVYAACLISMLLIARGGVVVVLDLRSDVVGSSLGWALRRKNSWQVSHTYVPLSPAV